MASIIKLKRSLTPSSIPSSLQEGELAVNLSDKKLFIGGENGGANVQVISGDLYNLTSSSGDNQATVTLTVDNDTLSNDEITFVGSDSLSVSESSGTISFDLKDSADGAVLSINGTTDEVAVTRSNGTVTIGLPDDVTVTGQLNVGENAVIVGNTQIGGSLTVDGDLNVEGAVTYISSSTVTIDDTMVKLAANNTTDTLDHGVYATYVDGGTTKYAGYFRDASDSSVFKFYKDLEVEPTGTVNTSGEGYTLAQIDAVIDGGTY